MNDNSFDMSQQPNRFSVLVCDSCNDDTHAPSPHCLQVESSAENSIMSPDRSSALIASLPSTSLLPERIFLRSLSLKYSTFLQVHIRALDTGNQIELHAS